MSFERKTGRTGVDYGVLITDFGAVPDEPRAAARNRTALQAMADCGGGRLSDGAFHLPRPTLASPPDGPGHGC
jgi:hypothetical protein